MPNYIILGCRYGFQIDCCYSHAKNLEKKLMDMESVWEHPEVVSSYVNKKYDRGRVEGPVDPADSPAVRVSGFGVMLSNQPGS